MWKTAVAHRGSYSRAAMGASKKKKRKAQRQKVAAAQQIKQEIAEELLAIEAIYAEDFQLHDDGVGFTLHIVPHPGELQANYVAVDLDVR